MCAQVISLRPVSYTHLDVYKRQISKRTGDHCVYVRGAAGKRAMGIAYAGGTN